MRTNMGAPTNQTKKKETKIKITIEYIDTMSLLKLQATKNNNNNKRIKKRTIRRCTTCCTPHTSTSSCEFSIQFITAKYYSIRRKVNGDENARSRIRSRLPNRKSNLFIYIYVCISRSNSSTHLIYQTIISIQIISSKFDSNTHAPKPTRLHSNQKYDDDGGGSNGMFSKRINT